MTQPANRHCGVYFSYHNEDKLMSCEDAKEFVSKIPSDDKLRKVVCAFSLVWKESKEKPMIGHHMLFKSMLDQKKFINLMNCGCYLQDGRQEAWDKCLDEAGIQQKPIPEKSFLRPDSFV